MATLLKLLRVSTPCIVLGCLAVVAGTASAQIFIQDPDVIHKDYRANKIRAIDNWNNKNVVVNGIVDDIEMGYVQVDSTTPLGGAVFCYYTNNINEISRLSPNQKVTASGRLQLSPRRFVGLKAELMECRISPR